MGFFILITHKSTRSQTPITWKGGWDSPNTQSSSPLTNRKSTDGFCVEFNPVLFSAPWHTDPATILLHQGHIALVQVLLGMSPHCFEWCIISPEQRRTLRSLHPTWYRPPRGRGDCGIAAAWQPRISRPGYDVFGWRSYSTKESACVY